MLSFRPDDQATAVITHASCTDPRVLVLPEAASKRGANTSEDGTGDGVVAVARDGTVAVGRIGLDLSRGDSAPYLPPCRASRCALSPQLTRSDLEDVRRFERL